MIMLDWLRKLRSQIHCSLSNKTRTGTRTYYAEGRYMIANVHGDYINNCFIPYANISEWLTQEQIDSIVLTETMPDD